MTTYATLPQATYSRAQADNLALKLRKKMGLPHLYCTTVITAKSGPIYRIATNAHLHTNRDAPPRAALHESLGR